MEYEVRDILEYLIAIIDDFGKKFNLSSKDAYRYLKFNKGLSFISEHYGVIHTLSFEDALENVRAYCRQNGGLL